MLEKSLMQIKDENPDILRAAKKQNRITEQSEKGKKSAHYSPKSALLFNLHMLILSFIVHVFN